MKKMSEHAQELEWAASWFRALFFISLSLAVIFIILLAIYVISGQANQIVFVNGVRASNSQVITAGGAGIVSSLVSAFLWRVGFIICSFLSDFASGLATQHIKKEHSNKS